MDTDGPPDTKRAATERGFSLLETLFALAIMSIASLALFQSTSAMLQLSDRAVKAGERTLNSGLDRQVLTALTEGILPAWPEAPTQAFTGEPARFSGISTGAPQSGHAKPVWFSLEIEDRGQNGHALIFRSLAQNRAANTQTARDDWTLIAGLPADIRFAYMGVDHEFYPEWPQEQDPTRGYFDDAVLMRPAAVPEAISLVDRDGQTLWTAAIRRSNRLPGRAELGVVR